MIQLKITYLGHSAKLTFPAKYERVALALWTIGLDRDPEKYTLRRLGAEFSSTTEEESHMVRLIDPGNTLMQALCLLSEMMYPPYPVAERIHKIMGAGGYASEEDFFIEMESFIYDSDLHTDNTTEYHYVPFNPELSDWQFVSCVIVPNPKDENGNPVVKTVKSIRIICAYETNVNVAWFDNISLVREITQTMKYDDKGNLVSATTSGLNVDVNTYDGGNLIQTVTGSQGIFQYTYDNTFKHRLMSVTQKDSSTEEGHQNNWITQSMSYDRFGNVISTTLSGPEVLPMSTSAQYTEDGNLLSSVTDATGATVTYGYDGYIDEDNVVLTDSDFSRMMGLPTSVTDPNGTETSTAYDLYGRITETSVAQLATLEYNYSNGNLSSITRTAGNKSQTYALQYDSFGKTTSISVGSSELAAYHYATQNGQLKVQEYENGHYVLFDYDSLGRTKTVTYTNVDPRPATVETEVADEVVPYTRTLSYVYNGEGQLHSVTETLNGDTTAMYLYQYDTLGNLVGSEKRAGGSPVMRTWHSYDNDNRLSAQGWQIGADSFTQTYSYDTWNGNLSAIVLSDNDSDTTDTTIGYTYDSLQRLYQINNGVFTSTYNYYDDTAAGKASPRLESIAHSGVNYSGKTVECNYTYEYDPNGNITKTSFGNRHQTYVYDSNNQLIRENNDRKQYTQTWEYDEFGNITRTQKYAYTIEDELGDPTSTVTYRYTNSNWGDLLTLYNGQRIEYDNIGNPLFVKDAQDNVVKSYTWTQGRHMASHTTNGATWTYTYDADGMRTGRTNGTNTYEYIYAGDKLVRMVKNGEVVDFGYAGGQLATMTYDGVTYYYVLNGQGDVVALVDSTGTMIIGYYYSAYGNVTLLKTEAETYNDLKYLNPFMYRGYVYDIETTLYYLQSRYYDPEWGRFINADGLVSTGQGVLGNNMFAYCFNNPVNMDDANGEWPKWVSGALNIVSGTLQAAAGAALGATVGWTGFGAAVAGFLFVNGSATASQGVGQIVNHVAQSNVLREDNIIRTGVKEVGRSVGGDTGAKVACGVYDVAVIAASVYAGKVQLQQKGILPIKVNIDDVVNNPLDEFVTIGPKDGAIGQYCQSIPQSGYGKIYVTQLENGLYQIANGHHRVAALRELEYEMINVYLTK